MLILLATLTATILLFIAYEKSENGTAPVVAETVEEIEETVVVEEDTAEEPELTEEEDVQNGETVDSNDSDTSTEVEESNVSGEDTETDEELEEHIEEQKDQEQQSGETPSDNTNGGKGYDWGDQHFDTLEEYLDALHKHAASVDDGSMNPNDPDFYDFGAPSSN